MIDTSFLDQLGRFSLVIHKRVTSNYIGPRKSIATGRGITFKEHRIYAPGDDFRLIDWKVYARSDNLYVKTYEEERNLIVHIIIDFSASMNFGEKVSKFDYACMLGAGFAFLAMKENEKFQYSTFSDNLEIFQPKKGMSQLAAMIHHLNNLKTTGKSNLKDAIIQYKKVLGSRAMVVLISDFLLDSDEIIESLYMLAGNEVKVIQVLDPIEKNMEVQGDFNLKDSETGDNIRTYVSPGLSQKYKRLLDEHSGKIEKACSDLKIDFNLITTNVPVFDAFYKILR